MTKYVSWSGFNYSSEAVTVQIYFSRKPTDSLTWAIVCFISSNKFVEICNWYLNYFEMFAHRTSLLAVLHKSSLSCIISLYVMWYLSNSVALGLLQFTYIFFLEIERSNLWKVNSFIIFLGKNRWNNINQSYGPSHFG